MMPDNVLSTFPIPAPFLVPDGGYSLMTDKEMGGVALNDPSQGLQYQIWTFQLTGDTVTASAPSVTATVLFTRSGITEISGTFDQNMRPAVAFVQNGIMKLWWFDSVSNAQIFTTFDGFSPKVSLDDKRRLEAGNSDIILSYRKNTGLFFRQQRDRYTIERMLFDPIPPKMVFTAFGMNSVNRLQWLFVPEADL